MTGILSSGQPYIPGLSDFRVAEADGQRRQAAALQQKLGMLNVQNLEEQQQFAPLRRALLQAQVDAARSPSLTRVDAGDRIELQDRAGNVVRTIPKGATPDTSIREAGADRRHAQPSGNTVYGGEVTMRGQDMVDRRTRDEGAANRGVTLAGINRPQFNADAGGWIIPPAVGGGAVPSGPRPQGPLPLGPSAAPRPAGGVIPVPGLAPKADKPPQGYRWGADGNLEAIPGGPADIKSGEKAEANRRRDDASLSRADIVINKVEKALDQTGFFTTGFIGSVSGGTPGMPAYNYQKTLDTIIGNIGFQELQAMREASPTGGALGQVAVKELEMLQSVLSNLDRGQSEGQQRDNLMAVGRHFQNWKNAVMQSRGLPPEPNKFDVAPKPMRRREDILNAADAILEGK